MLDLFRADGVFPFTLSLALFLGLLALELVFSLLGGSLMGAGAEVDGPELDLPEADYDVDFDFGDPDADIEGLETADLTAAPAETDGLASWFGFGRMPAAIWLAAVLVAFGLSGLTLQTVANGVLGTPLPAMIVAAPSALAALWFARRFGGLFARLLPKTETQALSERHLGRRTGIVSQGSAARGKPAEVKVTDRYGNIHYLRAEPLRDEAVIAQGTKVAVLRATAEGDYRLVPID